jgi:hypothetical protein
MLTVTRRAIARIPVTSFSAASASSRMFGDKWSAKEAAEENRYFKYVAKCSFR